MNETILQPFIEFNGLSPNCEVKWKCREKRYPNYYRGKIVGTERAWTLEVDRSWRGRALIFSDTPNTVPLPQSPLPPHRYRHAVTDNQAKHCVAPPTQCRISHRNSSGLQKRDHRRGFIARRPGEGAHGKRSSYIMHRRVCSCARWLTGSRRMTSPSRCASPMRLSRHTSSTHRHTRSRSPRTS